MIIYYTAIRIQYKRIFVNRFGRNLGHISPNIKHVSPDIKRNPNPQPIGPGFGFLLFVSDLKF